MIIYLTSEGAPGLERSLPARDQRATIQTHHPNPPTPPTNISLTVTITNAITIAIAITPTANTPPGLSEAID